MRASPDRSPPNRAENTCTQNHTNTSLIHEGFKCFNMCQRSTVLFNAKHYWTCWSGWGSFRTPPTTSLNLGGGLNTTTSLLSYSRLRWTWDIKLGTWFESRTQSGKANRAFQLHHIAWISPWRILESIYQMFGLKAHGHRFETLSTVSWSPETSSVWSVASQRTGAHQHTRLRWISQVMPSHAKLPISKLGYIERDGMKRGLNAQCPRFHMCPCFVYDTMTHICSVSWVTLGHALYKKASNQQSLQWLTVTGGAEREVWNVQLWMNREQDGARQDLAIQLSV